MHILRDLDDLPPAFAQGAVTIGNFDGVHRGHAAIVAQLRCAAEGVGGPAVVFTFDPHPVRLLRPDKAPPPLTWSERKAVLLGKLGVDAMLVYPTDEALLGLTSEAFFRRVVVERLQARAVVEGPNFFFGRGRTGDINVLAALCEAAGIALEVVPPATSGDAYISSSRIRELIARGQVRPAAEMLTEPYRIRGLVTHGAARGAKLGFPTANVAAVDTLLPARGVYAGRAYTREASWPAAVNIGPNPTFGEATVKVEAHLLDYDGSLYGQPLEVDFLERLREIRPFESVEQLRQQLTHDVAATRRICQATNEVISP